MHTGVKVKKRDLLGAGRNQSQNTGRGQNNRKSNKGKIQSQSQREHETWSKSEIHRTCKKLKHIMVV